VLNRGWLCGTLPRGRRLLGRASQQLANQVQDTRTVTTNHVQDGLVIEPTLGDGMGYLTSLLLITAQALQLPGSLLVLLPGLFGFLFTLFHLTPHTFGEYKVPSQ
jgi:hypothetical protein